MNSRYFLCRDHGVFIDAGYRWAYWQLEHAGVVTPGLAVDVPALLDTTAYLKPSAADSSDYLDDLLPRVRDFLDRHAGDDLLYVDQEWLHEKWELGYEYKEQSEPPMKL